MKKPIEQALEQLVCNGPMNQIPKKIPLLARAIEVFAVLALCARMEKIINTYSPHSCRAIEGI